MLIAQSGAGKSFWLEALAMHIAYGQDFCGFETAFGDVLIIDQDTPKDVLDRRLQCIGKALGGKPKHNITKACMEGYALSNSGRVINLINNYNAKLTIIDSLHSICGTLNSNSTSDMSIWAYIKSQCLREDRTIIVAHHITEHLDLKLEEMLDGNKHLSGMGNSSIKQQADTEYVLASSVADGRIDKIYVRPVAKRQAISQKPICMRMLEPSEDKIALEFNGYWEADMNEIELDVMLLFTQTDGEWNVKEIREKTGNKHTEKEVRVAVSKLEKTGKLVMNRHKSNLFKYRLPRIA